MKPTAQSTAGGLSDAGRKLLELITGRLASGALIPGRPETYLGYRECCLELKLAGPDDDHPWGRLLQREGLTNLNEWTIRHDLPRVSGLIVNQSGDRQYLPGGDYFKSNGRAETDWEWWHAQAAAAAAMDWRAFLHAA